MLSTDNQITMNQDVAANAHWNSLDDRDARELVILLRNRRLIYVSSRSTSSATLGSPHQPISAWWKEQDQRTGYRQNYMLMFYLSSLSWKIGIFPQSLWMWVVFFSVFANFCNKGKKFVWEGFLPQTKDFQVIVFHYSRLRNRKINVNLTYSEEVDTFLLPQE